MFLKRYDSIEVSGWGSVNDMIPWQLGMGDWETVIRFRERTEGGREIRIALRDSVQANTANYSMRLYHDSSNIIDIIRTGR
jgi:hypothetical protein